VVGVDGRGACAGLGIGGADDVVVTATLSKSLGSQGGVVLGPAVVVEHLVNTARSFIFDTGLAPAAVGAAAAALAVLRSEPDLPARARSAARDLAAGLTTAGVGSTTPDAAVVAVPVGAADLAVRAAERLRADGILVGCFRPPSVPDERSRLRLTGHAGLDTADVRRAVAAVAATLG
jgi:8-amino-7-oxononanoate synthase